MQTAAQPSGSAGASDIGREQHLADGQLRVQERIRQAAFTLHKVRGDCNPADLCTKHLGRTSADPMYSALLGWTSRPVEQVARHVLPLRLSSFQQVRDSCLPSMDVTRRTPSEKEECEIVTLNMCIISMILLHASSLEGSAHLPVAMTRMQRIEK